MAVRKIIQIGHLALKAKNKEIRNFYSMTVKKIIRDLKDTMKKQELIGIAAPQIAENYKIFVTHARNTKSRNLGKEDILRVFINPTITLFSTKKSVIYEGCGSVVDGNLFGPVERSYEITVEAYDENGKKFQLLCDGILAWVIQHEYDHLYGIEFLEKIIDYKKLMTWNYYSKIIKNSRAQKSASLITKIKYKKFQHLSLLV